MFLSLLFEIHTSTTYNWWPDVMKLQMFLELMIKSATDTSSKSGQIFVCIRLEDSEGSNSQSVGRSGQQVNYL